MATLDGMQLFDSVPTSGAAFLLNRPARQRLTVSAPDGWTGEVVPGGHYVVVRKPVALNGYIETRDSAFHAAQQVLDLFALSRSAYLSIRDAEIEHLTWWRDSGQVLRASFISTQGMEVRADVWVKDVTGNLVPPTPRTPTWHPSGRFFRLSQDTEDLTDAFFNLYRAMESILGHICPQNTTSVPPEREGAWFRRALGVAHTRASLAPYARGSTDPVGAVFNEFYGTRNRVFHAKGNRPNIIPQNAGQDRRDVAAAVEKMAMLYQDLTVKVLGAPGGRGFFTVDHFRLTMEPLKTSLRLHAADEAISLTPETTAANLGDTVELTTRHVPDLDALFLCSFVGEAPARGLPRLGAVAATVDGQLRRYCTTEGALQLDGVDRLEAHLGFRMANTGLPKKHFAT